MRMWTLARRNAREFLRDPLNLAFSLGFPIVLLLLLTAIQKNVPVNLFEIGHLTPGVAVFGLSFITLFSATILSKDRSSALLQRLYTTPLTAEDFILGYTLPILPIALGQCVACYLVALLLGLQPTVHIFAAIALMLPAAVLFVAMGLLFGSMLNDKQVGGICGALLTNLTAWLSGTWFDLELVGGGFKKIAELLPFVHAVELGRGALQGDYSHVLPHLCWVLAYAAVVLAAAIWVFLRQMKRQ